MRLWAVVGVVSQDDDEAPFDSGYRILPRRSADVQPGAKMPTTAAPVLDDATWNVAPLFLPVTGAAEPGSILHCVVDAAHPSCPSRLSRMHVGYESAATSLGVIMTGLLLLLPWGSHRFNKTGLKTTASQLDTSSATS